MNAVIKIGNVHHLQTLQDLMKNRLNVRAEKFDIVKLPFYNFVNEVIQVFSAFAKSNLQASLNMFFIEYFINRQRVANEVCRKFFGLLAMWRKYIDAHEEARELLSFLSNDRNSRQVIKEFLKIRKAILKNINSKIMQEITLNQQDIIVIAHTIFQTGLKTFITKRVYQMFVMMKRKLTNSSKVNGAVVCQFYMNCIEKYKKQALQSIDHVSPFKQIKTVQRTKSVSQLKNQDFKKDEDEFKKDVENLEGNEAQMSSRICDDEEAIKSFEDLQAQWRKQHSPSYHKLSKGENQESLQKFQNAKSLVSKKYAHSWQRFMDQNKYMKQKLLNRNHQRSVY